MFQLDPQFYGSSCAALLVPERLCPLGPGEPNLAARPALESLDLGNVVGSRAIRNFDMANCCISALWLRHNFLDESHSISQRIASPTGSYWHGIMHRREPDYSNGKYWFRRVGEHPVYEQLWICVQAFLESQPPDDDTASQAHTKALAQKTAWDPILFVDLCEAAAGGKQPLEAICRQIADLEWQLLFDYCYRQATGQ